VCLLCSMDWSLYKVQIYVNFINIKCVPCVSECSATIGGPVAVGFVVSLHDESSPLHNDHHFGGTGHGNV
jgi:hypothetical protein